MQEHLLWVKYQEQQQRLMGQTPVRVGSSPGSHHGTAGGVGMQHHHRNHQQQQQFYNTPPQHSGRPYHNQHSHSQHRSSHQQQHQSGAFGHQHTNFAQGMSRVGGQRGTPGGPLTAMSTPPQQQGGGSSTSNSGSSPGISPNLGPTPHSMNGSQPPPLADPLPAQHTAFMHQHHMNGAGGVFGEGMMAPPTTGNPHRGGGGNSGVRRSEHPSRQPKVYDDGEEETDDRRLSQRKKQVNFGKVTEGYSHYRDSVPPYQRQPDNSKHPITPRVNMKCSKRRWDTLVAAWRRSLHAWDHKPSPAEMVVPGAPTLLELGQAKFIPLQEYVIETKRELEEVQEAIKHLNAAEEEEERRERAADRRRRGEGEEGERSAPFPGETLEEEQDSSSDADKQGPPTVVVANSPPASNTVTSPSDPQQTTSSRGGSTRPASGGERLANSNNNNNLHNSNSTPSRPPMEVDSLLLQQQLQMMHYQQQHHHHNNNNNGAGSSSSNSNLQHQPNSNSGSSKSPSPIRFLNPEDYLELYANASSATGNQNATPTTPQQQSSQPAQAGSPFYGSMIMLRVVHRHNDGEENEKVVTLSGVGGVDQIYAELDKHYNLDNLYFKLPVGMSYPPPTNNSNSTPSPRSRSRPDSSSTPTMLEQTPPPPHRVVPTKATVVKPVPTHPSPRKDDGQRSSKKTTPDAEQEIEDPPTNPTKQEKLEQDQVVDSTPATRKNPQQKLYLSDKEKLNFLLSLHFAPTIYYESDDPFSLDEEYDVQRELQQFTPTQRVFFSSAGAGGGTGSQELVFSSSAAAGAFTPNHMAMAARLSPGFNDLMMNPQTASTGGNNNNSGLGLGSSGMGPGYRSASPPMMAGVSLSVGGRSASSSRLREMTSPNPTSGTTPMMSQSQGGGNGQGRTGSDPNTTAHHY